MEMAPVDGMVLEALLALRGANPLLCPFQQRLPVKDYKTTAIDEKKHLFS